MEQHEPKILQARFATTCAKCNGSIRQNDLIIHWPEHKLTFHATCGREAYQSFWFQRLYKATQAYNLSQTL